jgi:hypothetical protein
VFWWIASTSLFVLAAAVVVVVVAALLFVSRDVRDFCSKISKHCFFVHTELP